MPSQGSALGVLGILPREVRDIIYSHVVLWPSRYTDTATALFYVRYPNARRNRLSIARTSSRLCEEVSSLLYDGWKLNIWVSKDEFMEDAFEYDAMYPEIDCKVSHVRHGTYHLPQLGGRAERNAATDRYRNMPHERWQSVTVDLKRPGPFPFILRWRASRLISFVFQSRAPKCLLILPPGPLKSPASITMRAKKRIEPTFSLQQALLMPFYCIKRTAISLPTEDLPSLHDTQRPYTSSVHQFGLREQPSIVAAARSPSFINTLKTMPVDRTSESHVRTMMAHVDLIECWLDYHLDSFRGTSVAYIRDHRWMFWDRRYERHVIQASAALGKGTRKHILAALVERWAVMRAMDPKLRAADDLAWQGSTQSASKNTDLGDIQVPERAEEGKGEDPLDKWHDMEMYHNPRRSDWKFAHLKYTGLFYHRRILVSREGISWDPNHTSETLDSLYEDRENIIFVHQPPKKPDEPPTPWPDDESFYRPGLSRSTY